MALLTISGTAADAACTAAARMAGAIDARRGAPGGVHIALAGGSTPRAAYERLADQVPSWKGVELWLGDERVVPPDDPESNYRLVAETLLAATQAAAHQVPTGGTAEDAAASYSAEMRRRVAAGPSGVPVLDFALLGLGEDGHTASLFPNHPALEARGEVCVAVHGAPKPPPDRVTLTLDVLRATRTAAILAVGDGKADAVAATLAGPSPQVPASLLADGPLELILDEAAAAKIPADAKA
jgi:6-phosphogluconolactonase